MVNTTLLTPPGNGYYNTTHAPLVLVNTTLLTPLVMVNTTLLMPPGNG